MMHPDQMYQLRQLRNRELLMEAQQARITQELVRNQSLLEYGKGGTTRMKLILRYARYVLTTLTTVGFGIQLN
jgi:hypothetical protein